MDSNGGSAVSFTTTPFHKSSLAKSPFQSPPYLNEHKKRQRHTEQDLEQGPTTTTTSHRKTLSSSSTSSIMPVYTAKTDMTLTPAERARQKSLLDDPLALVLDPSHVECRRCKKKIKLSSKSYYDTFHWRNHRARCARTSKKKGRAPRPRSLDLKKEFSPAPSLDGRTISPAGSDGRGLHTPPLMSDSDDGGHASDRGTELSSPIVPTLPVLPISHNHSPVSPNRFYHHPATGLSTPSIRHPDNIVMDDYISRLHPECAGRPFGPLTTEPWKNWDWSQLKQPHFPPLRPMSGEDEGEDEDEYVEKRLPHPTSQDRDSLPDPRHPPLAMPRSTPHWQHRYAEKDELEAASVLSSLARGSPCV